MKKKNHFDSKDMVLLVVTLIILYMIMSWFGNNGEIFDDSYYNGPSVEATRTPSTN